jgi:seryl-tRNA synthetase
MLDAALFRDDFDATRDRLLTRGSGLESSLAALAELDQARRRILPRVETLKHERNQTGEAIAKAKRAGEDASALLEANRAKAEEIKALDAELEAIEVKRKDILLRVPNLPHASVPVGTSAEDNQVVRTWGTPRQFDFEPKAHWDLGIALGIVDFERGVRMSGARFAVLLGAGSQLSRALIQFMLDLHTREHGYT